MPVNVNSIEAWCAFYKTTAPTTQADRILVTMNYHDRPMYMQEIAELSGLPERNMGQILGKDLIASGQVFRLQVKGKNKAGRKVDLFVTSEYLQDPLNDCPEAYGDPRFANVEQKSLF